MVRVGVGVRLHGGRAYVHHLLSREAAAPRLVRGVPARLDVAT